MLKMDEKKIRILVVDDLEIIREHLKSYFERRYYTMLVAGSAEEALPIIKEQNPEIMLLDINLPKMSGIELLGLVRQFNKTIKVIMVSGYHIDYKNDSQFQGLDVFELMQKPVDLAELEAVIKKAVMRDK